MKHVAILQSADLFIALVELCPMRLISYDHIGCKFLGFVFIFFILFQTLWVTAVSRYNYQVIYLKVDKEEITILKPFLLGVCISTAIGLLAVFDCIKVEKRTCMFGCDKWTESIIVILQICVIVSCCLASSYFGALLLGKLKKDLRCQLNEMKWSMFRLSVYPLITFICLAPSSILLFLRLNHSDNEFLRSASIILFNSIGFLNSIALGFTPEFKDALRFHLKKKSLPLVNLNNK